MPTFVVSSFPFFRGKQARQREQFFSYSGLPENSTLVSTQLKTLPLGQHSCSISVAVQKMQNTSGPGGVIPCTDVVT